jgi:DNA adenine methylase|uniref:site-specific DNA-methyltransferase (adenine-specific) n=1 Tax=viral metagenome TaxID=1070528 RepID=A0A6C0D122_9ZZZZ
MTYYPGGKKYKGKEIANIIYEESTIFAEESDFKIKGYCEPFCGMMGVYRHIPKLFSQYKLKYKAGDRNNYLVKLWKAIQNGFDPPTTCSKNMYYKMKTSNDQSLNAIFLGFACSIRGIFRGTFFPPNNVKHQAIQMKEIGKEIIDVNIKGCDYTKFSNLSGYIIYCDPPYKNTGNVYSIEDKYDSDFDYSKFTDWCINMSKNNIIFISEYKKPCKEAVLVWKRDKERLYIL